MENKNKELPIDEQNSQSSAVKNLIKSDPWEEIGFHRPLGSFWFDLSIRIFSAIVSLLFVSLIFQLLYPYPEMQGYNKVATGVFAILYNIFDMGTAFGIERFISEYRIKDTKKMLEYVRFFVWYQMFTGLLQVALVSVYILQYLKNNVEFAYLSWLFLIICQKQWPGMLGTFKSVLKGLQKYNKSKILDFVGGSVFQNLTNIIFILLGRWWGQQNPQIGDLMGGALGYALGSYIDDFFTMGLSAWYLNKELKFLGFTLRDALVPSVGMDVIKKCMYYGFQASLVPILSIVSETFVLLLFLDNLPQYTTWIVLKSFAGDLVGIVNVGNFEITSSIAESYSNDKKTLTEFYVSNSLKWNGFLMMFLMIVLVGFLPIITEVVLGLEGLANYQASLIFIPFLLLEQLFFPYIQISDPILLGTLHVPFYTFVRFLEEIVRYAILYLLLVVFQLPTALGAIGIALTLGYDRFYARLVKMVIALIYVNRRVFKVRIYWISSFIIPLIAALPVLGYIQLWNTFILPSLIDLMGLMPAAGVTILLSIMIVPTCIFLPLVGYLGGFDEFQLKTFEKAVNLSGPSKPLVKIFYKSLLWGHSRCHWPNKFKIPWEVPEQQIHDLLILKAGQTPDL